MIMKKTKELKPENVFIEFTPEELQKVKTHFWWAQRYDRFTNPQSPYFHSLSTKARNE